ncbi:hypothetical protein KSS87_015202 [Heliosperma pusillum]|nr:hypothetical protein KSS87_015202 [Heliosperma pusillum]
MCLKKILFFPGMNNGGIESPQLEEGRGYCKEFMQNHNMWTNIVSFVGVKEDFIGKSMTYGQGGRAPVLRLSRTESSIAYDFALTLACFIIVLVISYFYFKFKFINIVLDLIEELVKNGKQVEAVYFATESGLTDRFQPVSLLKSSLQKTDRESRDIRKKGNHSASVTDKANSLESISIRSIIKCVEDHKLEEDFPVESLRKRLAVLERAKNDRKNGTTARVMHNKRANDGGGRGLTSGPPSSRPAKVQKPSSPYTKSPLSPVSRYLGPYTNPTQTSYPGQAAYHSQTAYPSTYPSQPTYDTGLAAAAPVYQTAQQHYGIPGNSGASTEARLNGSYGSQTYDYGAAPAAPAYGQTSYPQ